MAKSKGMTSDEMRAEYVRLMRACRDEKDEDGNPKYPGSGSLETFEELIHCMPEEILADLFYMNFGFAEISDLDFKVIRADIMVERAMRGLASAIALNPIPDTMNAGAVRNFVRLMTPLDLDFIKASKHLGDARNNIAHQLHGDYTKDLQAMYKALDVPCSGDFKDFHAVIAILLSAISNRREDVRMKNDRIEDFESRLNDPEDQ